MSKKLISSVILATTLVSGAALAAPQNKIGEVRSTDAVKHELVLSTGDTFVLPKTFKMSQLKPGEKVKITYESKDGKMIASHVKPAN